MLYSHQNISTATFFQKKPTLKKIEQVKILIFHKVSCLKPSLLKKMICYFLIELK